MIKASLAAGIVMFAGSAFAADSGAEVEGKTTTMRIEDAKPVTEANKPASGVDADTVITNRKMRAESGSKSKWSIGSALTYSGGTLKSPGADIRPNLTGAAGTTDTASLGGTVGVGYKMTTTDRISVDFGVRWITPFDKNKPKGYEGDKVDASNPSITYSKMYKLGDVQSVFSAGPLFYTATDLRQIGYRSAFQVQQVNAYEIGKSGASLGLVLAADGYTFGRDDLVSRQKTADYDFSVIPFAEYVINDTLNVRTVFNWMNFEHKRNAGSATTFKQTRIQQSVGVGISVTRDIFLYPNVQFTPVDISHVFDVRDTNVALNANINVF